jgi:hypothetical protein
MEKDYREALDDPSTDDAIYWSYRTYLDWDYDRSPYDGENGTRGGKYGPSSHHPRLVNHAMMDGSVRSFSTRIDVALYMDLIRPNPGY